MEEGRRTVRLPPVMEAMRARMGTGVIRIADIRRSRPLDRHMTHTVEGTRTEGMVGVMVRATVTLAVLEAANLPVVEAIKVFRPRRILVGHYARSLPRGG